MQNMEYGFGMVSMIKRQLERYGRCHWQPSHNGFQMCERPSDQRWLKSHLKSTASETPWMEQKMTCCVRTTLPGTDSNPLVSADGCGNKLHQNKGNDLGCFKTFVHLEVTALENVRILPCFGPPHFEKKRLLRINRIHFSGHNDSQLCSCLSPSVVFYCKLSVTYVYACTQYLKFGSISKK